jgi:hypothetical protein
MDLICAFHCTVLNDWSMHISKDVNMRPQRLDFLSCILRTALCQRLQDQDQQQEASGNQQQHGQANSLVWVTHK